jgi:ribosomal protein RSM22 (predicted rRNA methylase)
MFFAPEKINFPSSLDEELRKALWNGSPSPEALKKRGAVLARLWERLAKRRGVNEAGETHYAFQRPEADAYASYYLTVNALKTALVMEEAWLLGVDAFSPAARWVDFGTGPGTAFWGLAWWAKVRKKKLQFSGFDQSPVFAEIASSLSRGRPFGSSAQFSSDRKLDFTSIIRRADATHVSFVNSVNEIFPDSAERFERIKAIMATLNELSQRDKRPRYLLLIEPGSRDSSRELATLKDRLQAELPVRSILPCFDARPCGALVKPTDWCHEEVACDFPEWVNELGGLAGLRKDSILFSYSLLRTGVEELMPGAMRVVSHRFERKGQVECFFCTKEGKIFARAQRSKATEDSKHLLEASRGDIWLKASLGPKGDVEAAKVWPGSCEPSVVR